MAEKEQRLSHCLLPNRQAEESERTFMILMQNFQIEAEHWPKAGCYCNAAEC